LKTKVEILGETWELIAACSTYYDKRPSTLQEVVYHITSPEVVYHTGNSVPNNQIVEHFGKK
jgi:hypothetical protein